MQGAFKDEGKNSSIRNLGENLMPILFAKKFARFFVSQCQKAKHGDIVSRHLGSLIRLSRAIRLRLIVRSNRFSSLLGQKRMKILSRNTQICADFPYNF